ncbi:MAG TPA: nitroreductase/quinone reductase family protein [Acidimicrobiales bacterium]|nr:nitroreductase/quinone reductase family protein [Acidimicrobiales bacterium]
MPADFFFKAANNLHRTVLNLSGGRVGGSTMNMPVLQLTTTGRKSGRKRTVMLTTPVQEADTIVVVASRGGDPQHPAWFLNLRDDPRVEVAMGAAAPKPMRARVADTDERARLWPLVTAKYKGYADYQKRAKREIPLVLLEPAS